MTLPARAPCPDCGEVPIPRQTRGTQHGPKPAVPYLRYVCACHATPALRIVPAAPAASHKPCPICWRPSALEPPYLHDPACAARVAVVLQLYESYL